MLTAFSCFCSKFTILRTTNDRVKENSEALMSERHHKERERECVCVCVCEREREKEREWAIVC